MNLSLRFACVNIEMFSNQVVSCRGAENVRMRERGSGEILADPDQNFPWEIFINNLKTENKWIFLLTGGNFHKHQSK